MCLGERMWFAHLAESPVPAALNVSECKRTTLDAVVAATEAGDLEVQPELTAVRSQLGEVETVAAGDELIAEAKAEREAARKLQEDANHLARVWSASTLVVGGSKAKGRWHEEAAALQPRAVVREAGSRACRSACRVQWLAACEPRSSETRRADAAITDTVDCPGSWPHRTGSPTVVSIRVMSSSLRRIFAPRRRRPPRYWTSLLCPAGRPSSQHETAQTGDDTMVIFEGAEMALPLPARPTKCFAPNEFYSGSRPSRGSRTVSLKQIARAIERESRRQHQAAVRHQRDVAKEFREAQKRQAVAEKEFTKVTAAADVASFNAYLSALESFHHHAIAPIDWSHAVAAQPPNPPLRNDARQKEAQAAIDRYEPGWVDRTFGGAKRQTAKLGADLLLAQQMDADGYQQVHQQYLQAHAEWEQNRGLAQRILAGDTSGFEEVLSAWNPPSVLEPFSISAELLHVDTTLAEYGGGVDFDASVPSEELKLTAAGNPSRKNMALGKRWALCQDQICSAALRLAADTFALLPVQRVIVNLGGRSLNTATGHWESTTWLAAHLTREALSRINLRTLDPSDSMENFQVRMKFRKTKGFAAVEPITADDQWVTT